MSVSSALKASLFAIVVMAAFSSLAVVSEAQATEGPGAGTSFTDNGLDYLIMDDGNAEVSGPVDITVASLEIPSSVTYGASTYDVTSIGSWAFSNCIALTSVTIPDSITSIGPSAFYNCTSLPSVTIPSNVTFIGDYAFRECTGQTSVTIPDSVTSIGYDAFHGCTGLTSLTMPIDFKVAVSAFEGCTGLTSVTLTYGRTGEGASYTLSDYRNTPWYDNCSNTISVVISEGVTSIGNNTFHRCTGLTSVTIPSSITSMGEYAFSGCTGLTSVTIPSGVTSMGDDVFSRCTGLTSVMIPGSVTSIGNWAFHCCTGLTSVMIPGSVTSIGNWAFSGCTGLTSATIPDSVTSIGNDAFSRCTGLTSVTISSGITSIGDNAFYGLTFFSEDGTTVLKHTVGDLCGHRFAGTYEKMVRGGHTVTYVVDGGSVPAPVQSALSEGRSFEIADYDGTRDGYTFEGWSDGTDVYQAGDEYVMGTSDVTLTAVWETSEGTSTTVWIAGALIAVIIIVAVAVLYRRRANL